MKKDLFISKSIIILIDYLCYFCPSIHGLQRIIDLYLLYASSHNITYNFQKTLGLSSTSNNF